MNLTPFFVNSIPMPYFPCSSGSSILLFTIPLSKEVLLSCIMISILIAVSKAISRMDFIKSPFSEISSNRPQEFTPSELSLTCSFACSLFSFIHKTYLLYSIIFISEQKSILRREGIGNVYNLSNIDDD